MKNIMLFFGLILMMVTIVGADFRKQKEADMATLKEQEKKSCHGYTIIEFGKGINCYGDTVVLAKVPGGQQLADVY